MNIKKLIKELLFLLADSEDQIEREVITPSSYLKIKIPIEEKTYKLLIKIMETVGKSSETDIKNLRSLLRI